MTTQIDPQAIRTETERFRESLETGDLASMAELYTPDALLDANLPSWRLQRQGPEAILAQFEEWYPAPARLVEWREQPTEWGAVVELAELLGEGESETYNREVYLFFTQDGRITDQILYCTGGWDRATLERHARRGADGQAAAT